MPSAGHKPDMELTKDTHIYGMSVVGVLEETHRVITTPHCIHIFGVSSNA